MFVQIIQGRTEQPDAVQQRFDSWTRDLAPSADGWLGSTLGLTDDGTVFATARFASEEQARRNSDRPEQGQWWAQTEPLLDGVTFDESTDIDTFRAGPDAGGEFVQVIQARVRDEAAASQLRAQMTQDGPERDDVVGGMIVVLGDRMTNVVYFRDEASARAAEAGEPTEDDEMMMKQMEVAFEAPTYLDLRRVVHYRP